MGISSDAMILGPDDGSGSEQERNSGLFLSPKKSHHGPFAAFLRNPERHEQADASETLAASRSEVVRR